MLKNQKRLEEEQAVKIKIIETKEAEIARLQRQLERTARQEDVLTGCPLEVLLELVTAPRSKVREGLAGLQRLLASRAEDTAVQGAWSASLLAGSANILGTILTNLL